VDVADDDVDGTVAVQVGGRDAPSVLDPAEPEGAPGLDEPPASEVDEERVLLVAAEGEGPDVTRVAPAADFSKAASWRLTTSPSANRLASRSASSISRPRSLPSRAFTRRQ